MPSPARGWFTHEGKPRYEVREALGSAEGDDFHRAWDRMSEREVFLVVGGESLAARASVAGRLEHPAAVTVYDVGRDPEGRVFLAAMDHTVARPLSKCLDEMTRDEVLRAVVTVAHAAAHAEGRGVLHPRLDLDQVLLFPDGHFRVIGWDEPGERHDSAARGVQKLLRRAIVPYGKAPKPLWSIDRHEYKDAGQLARDLGAYLDGASTLRATKLPLRQRLAAWGHRRPALATLAAGSGVVVLLAALVLPALVYFVKKGDEEERRAAEEARVKRVKANLQEAATLIEKVSELDNKRRDALTKRRAEYHKTESQRLSDAEIELDGELLELSSDRAGKAQLASSRLDLAERDLEGRPDPRLAEGRLVLEKGRLEYLFAVAAYEESKTISTATIQEARKTAQGGDLPKGHAYRVAAQALADTLSKNPGWRDALSDLARALQARGTLVVSRLGEGDTATISELGHDAEERWTLGEEKTREVGEELDLAVGVYLVRVDRGGKEFRFEVLLERGEYETVNAGLVPDDLPEGFVWIPPAEFYRGGEGLNPTRYRKDEESVTKPFAIFRTEPSWEESDAWGWGRPHLGMPPDLPVVLVTQPEAQRLAESLKFGQWRGFLPAEAQWELAARGVAGRSFPWGNKYIERAANTQDYSQEGRPTPVGLPQTDLSIFGVQGMAGNVLEWTASRFSEGFMVVKGGYYHAGSNEAICAARQSGDPASAQTSVGVRPALRREP
ncbi:MAG: SUMF1/EgtB/PvdO family nonheme iron enzyme [Planctomycetes bacterium]|nr:SUMF1/EgtB/PvdO family nonheme iron enzyme [Planctomycetota bacterium]